MLSRHVTTHVSIPLFLFHHFFICAHLFFLYIFLRIFHYLIIHGIDSNHDLPLTQMRIYQSLLPNSFHLPTHYPSPSTHPLFSSPTFPSLTPQPLASPVSLTPQLTSVRTMPRPLLVARSSSCQRSTSSIV